MWLKVKSNALLYSIVFLTWHWAGFRRKDSARGRHSHTVRLAVPYHLDAFSTLKFSSQRARRASEPLSHGIISAEHQGQNYIHLATLVTDDSHAPISPVKQLPPSADTNREGNLTRFPDLQKSKNHSRRPLQPAGNSNQPTESREGNRIRGIGVDVETRHDSGTPKLVKPSQDALKGFVYSEGGIGAQTAFNITTDPFPGSPKIVKSSRYLQSTPAPRIGKSQTTGSVELGYGKSLGGNEICQG
ncbi:hypothetical protein DFP72DRAFT_844666 [Ephemerocybe angulata]|uniref:Uncharacterized protein n=1 Tax=Ephemerocybe angulata TaxID=980116 RepID=A0A8H6MAH3_9AGAR|nr:hypothetical protein DFP72DRAFT_844664 [Tulosesus angulatus]KAF6758869.1 hypothetical protein DFP72DRAFT_844666 [Tulosesus angulatus]